MTWCCRYASGVAGVSVARVPAWWLEFALVAGGGVVVYMLGGRDVSLGNLVLPWILMVFRGGWLVRVGRWWVGVGGSEDLEGRAGVRGSKSCCCVACTRIWGQRREGRDFQVA